jgi:hypothetical protein
MRGGGGQVGRADAGAAPEPAPAPAPAAAPAAAEAPEGAPEGGGDAAAALPVIAGLQALDVD